MLSDCRWPIPSGQWCGCIDVQMCIVYRCAGSVWHHGDWKCVCVEMCMHESVRECVYVSKLFSVGLWVLVRLSLRLLVAVHVTRRVFFWVF